MSIFKLGTEYRVVADRFLLEGKSEEERNEIVKRLLTQNFRGNEYINLEDGRKVDIACKNRELHKMDRPGICIREAKYKIRQVAISHLDELLETSRYLSFESDYKKKHGANVTGFEKRTVEIEIYESLSKDIKLLPQIFELELTVCCKEDRNIIYDISKINLNKKDTYSVLLRSAKAERITEIDKVSLHKKIAQLPGYVKTDFLETSKYVLDREPPDGDIWKSELAKRQKQRMLMTKNLKQHGFIPEKEILDRMELLSSLLHCNVGVKEISSWYKKGMFEGSEEISGYVKNLAGDLRRQEVNKSCILPEEPTR